MSGDAELADASLTDALLSSQKKEHKIQHDARVESPFWAKLKLATSMAFWVTFFYVPLVVPCVHQWFFVDMDLPNKLGSSDFESYWPNTVQLIVFTVYFTTGNTVQLAWQGLAGTMAAGVNQHLMGKLFPMGGKCLKMTEATGGLRGFCEEFADPNYQTFYWFVWFDVFFYMFVLLGLNCNENTMKFGLSWHVTYMMAFMSTGGYQPSHSVTLTTILGVSLSVVITLFPFKQLVASKLDSWPLKMTQKVSDVSKATVKFMLTDRPETPDARYTFKVNKLSIENSVSEILPMAVEMMSDYQTSWWEGWLYGIRGGLSGATRFHRMRTHCSVIANAFQDSIGGFDDSAFLMKNVVSSLDAQDYTYLSHEEISQVTEERAQLRPFLEKLTDKSMDLLVLLSNWEAAQMQGTGVTSYQDSVGLMKQQTDEHFHALHSHYTEWVNKYPVSEKAQRQMMRSSMSVFLFSILQLSKQVMDLSDDVLKVYQEDANVSATDLFVNAIKDYWADLVSTFVSDGKSPTVLMAFTNPEKRSFVFRNLITIGLCFLMGNFMDGNIFAPYNPLLAATLSVLVSHFPGSAFYKNQMRLLGLSLGNTVPIIMLAFVSLFGDFKPLVHLICFFLFELYFALIYYTSPEWSYVGCIVAGFGCYSFVTESWNDLAFENMYKKIGQVTAAIFVQIVVDLIDTSYNKKFPKDIVLANMQEMTDGLQHVFRTIRDHLSSTDPSDELMAQIKQEVSRLKTIFAAQETMVSECENKATMIAGPAPAFKLDLYKGCLDQIKELFGELDALCLIDDFSAKLGGNTNQSSTEWFKEDFLKFYGQLLQAMESTFKTLMQIMKKKDEGPLLKEDVHLTLIDEDPTNHYEGLRMATVKRIIANTLDHVLEIEHLCCASGAMELDIKLS